MVLMVSAIVAGLGVMGISGFASAQCITPTSDYHWGCSVEQFSPEVSAQRCVVPTLDYDWKCQEPKEANNPVSQVAVAGTSGEMKRGLSNPF